ncbi:MAG TPA: molybdenum cofactor biosynthesis protein MoaE [Opitutaceae bacterium]|nr:molybdenum cofactor biosynthesis protein MoaE [Opitutaceae bacterium]
MHLHVEVIDWPISPGPTVPPSLAGPAGALAEFRGLVRNDEGGQPISALEYEAYSPMAEQTMRRIAREIGGRHGVLSARIVHRVGIVPVGEAAIHLVVAARHRGPAFVFLSEFMDRLKQDVPIWKIRALDRTGRPLAAPPVAPTPPP